MANAHGLGGRELIAESLEPMLQEQNVVSESVLHGPVWGNGLNLRIYQFRNQGKVRGD